MAEQAKQQPLRRRASDQSTVAHKRRATDNQVLPSSVLGRLCLVLLVAPWIVILALKNIFDISGEIPSLFSFVLVSELAVTSLACLALVTSRMTQLRRYETGREHERLLFSHSRDGMLLLRVVRRVSGGETHLSFVIQAENPAAIERLSSIGQAVSYVGYDVDEVFPQWLRRQVRQEYAACVQSARAHRYEVCNPDGKPAHDSIATPVMDASGRCVTHLVVIMRDIGERIMHERRLAVALKKAQAANASKSEFLASMSHELRTPLNAVIGFSEALTSGIGGPVSDRQREYLEYIHQSGSHLLEIISDILDLSKIEAGQVALKESACDLGKLVDSCIAMVKERALQKNLPLKCNIARGMPDMVADPLRVKQVLINLLSNAIKFTERGAVMVEADFSRQTGFELTVTDTGIGMTAEEQRIAMQPFGQVESAFSRNYNGTGLGLPIARHLAILHGGALAMSSTPGLGTRITITFPPARAAAKENQDRTLPLAV